MADVQENNSSSGIKLFGATITLKERSQLPNEDGPKKLSDDQTAAAAAAAEADKRPDKIIPCPRCKSMETKFCYFNNYNVNQPRHFCKGCQRYWTAGGALRNVPVGAGRRKAKPPCQALSSLSEGCSLFDDSGRVVRQLDFNAVVEEWQAAEHGGGGGFGQLFPGKRRRCASDSQSY